MDNSTTPNAFKKIIQVRSEYTSARLIFDNLSHRIKGSLYKRYEGYHPPEVDYITGRGDHQTIRVRDYDVRSLDRVSSEKAIDHLTLIHLARQGDSSAANELKRRRNKLHSQIGARFVSRNLVENDYVVPYTTEIPLSEEKISNKGAMLLDLSRRGFATPDFSLLSANVYELSPKEKKQCALDAIHNLETLSGRRLGDPHHPLLVAMRTAMPAYIPGYMPTFLNVGLSPEMLSGLPKRYGEEAAARIRLNNRKTILEALDPSAFKSIEKEMRPDLSADKNHALSERIENIISGYDPELISSPHHQIHFFLAKAYQYYDDHLDALRNFMGKDTHFPSIIVQRMVCSVIDRHSYAGVLYSRHPRKGQGVYLQYARTIYGEDLMTGRLQPEIADFDSRHETRSDFPAIYHFWERLFQLERIYASPVMVEFTGVHGTFTILQVNQAELTGSGMLTAVMDLHFDKKIPATRVKELIKPYHVRQIESDAIDPKSLHTLTPFCRGLSLLPRTAVSGRIFFSTFRAKQARQKGKIDKIILVKRRFSPTDAIEMKTIDGICSMSPAAIHVVTNAQNLGIPALLNLEEDNIYIDEDKGIMRNEEGEVLKEGDWATLSSRKKTLFIGRAVFAPARLLRYMAGEHVEITPKEKQVFERLSSYYRRYREILENMDILEFESLKDLGHAVRYGRLQKDFKLSSQIVNRCFDAQQKKLAEKLFDSTLGMHLVTLAAYELLSLPRKVRLLKVALKLARKKNIWGYQAGAFVIGSLVKPSSSVSFWKSFTPEEVGQLINEWILHEKYIHILDNVGEKRVSRAKDFILTQGLGSLHLHKGLVGELLPLKLSRVDLKSVKKYLRKYYDRQTGAVIDTLNQPYSAFYDYSSPWSLKSLENICKANNVPIPAPEDI